MAEAPTPAAETGPILHLPHQVLASLMVPMVCSFRADSRQDYLMDALRLEVLPAAARNVSPLADQLISAAEQQSAAWDGRGEMGDASLTFQMARGKAESVLADYFSWRAVQGIDRLRANAGGQNAT